jgi:tripartite-type tricarboxylate transporter receptor subunit TctC
VAQVLIFVAMRAFALRRRWPRSTHFWATAATGYRGGVVLIGVTMDHEQGSMSGSSVASRLRAFVGAVLAAAILGMAAGAAAAQNYPTRAVKIIVPFPAGGTADLMPRIVADWLSRKWKQAVTIENKPGAAGNIGAEMAFNAEPDGYTLLSAPPPPLVINQSLYPKLGFDPTAFLPISVMGIVPNALVVNPNKVSAKTVAELIAYARANPGRLTSATQGNGTTSHLTSEMFQMMAKVQFLHVPYRGSAPALQGMLAGDCDIMFDNLGVSLALVKSGQLRLLGVGTQKRMAALPDVSTIAETLPGFASSAWFAVVAPPKTARAIVEKISADIAEAIRSPDVARRLDELSAEPIGSSPDASARFMREESERWGNVVRAAGVKLD